MAEGREPVAWAGRRAVVAFPEHVGESDAARIREQLLAVLEDGAAVVIADMSATASCHPAGLDTVSLACQQAAIRRAELRLVAAAPAVRRLLAARGLDRLVPVYPSMEAAVAAGEPDGPGPADEAVLRQLLDALADGIVLADEDGQIMLANRQAAAMFGYRPGELAGQLVEQLVPAGLRDAHRLDRAAYALKPAARPMADRAQLAGLRRDGTTIPVTITLSPVPTASGHFVLAVIRDATHERWQHDVTDLIRGALAEQAQHTAGLLDRVVGGLFHVGLSLNAAAGQPAELARDQITQALQRLDDMIHEIRDHAFRPPHPDGGGPPW